MDMTNKLYEGFAGIAGSRAFSQGDIMDIPN